ncbi:Kinesin light chain [Methanosarcina siciliae C2J]|uniref:Kinesin light chain n=1 Tax=Methanosarcina siciliae C2J TaxID=1434118 RepID=A0A0E3PN18_9EURY|nr:tetratricopeptide repeat protein [Methanosarcina siciliae]AKB35897.1 Kinesin light chain [Methanosarcina siciliae C2J]
MSISPRGCFDKNERPFVDRETYIQALREALNNLDQKDYSVLVYYGVGGIGKTSLRKELSKLLEKHKESHKNLNVIWANVDFSIESHRQMDKFLIILKNQLHEKYGVKFHLFDIGHAVYWRKVNPQLPLLKDSYSEGSIVTDLLDTFGGLVSINYRSIKSIVESAPDRFKEWALKRDEAIANIVNMEAAEIEKKLPIFWANDLADYLNFTSSSAVIFIDTYEALWESHRGQGNFNSKDKWVRDLVAELPGVLWVICGREALRWEEVDEDWNNYLEQQHIGKLPEKDAVDLLNICGVENEEIQKVILDGSKGVPYYLDLAIDTYNTIKKKRQPVPADFSGTRSEVFERFIKYLDKQEIETLKVLSAPRFWDYYLFEALVKKFNTGYPLTSFSDLGNFSFTSRNHDGKWYMHQLMKEGLQEYQARELRERVHRFIFDYYTEKLSNIDVKSVTEEHKTALMEGFYHAKVVLKTPELLKWLIASSKTFDDAALWSFLVPLYNEMLRIQEMELPPEHPDIGATLHKMAWLYKDMGRYKDALPLYQRSLEIRKKVLGLEHPDVADTLNRTAWVYFEMGDYKKAKPLYQQALEIRENMLGPEHLEVAKTLNGLAVLYRNMGKYEQALSLYLQSFEIRKKVLGSEHPDVAKTLNNMAVLYRNMGEYEKAVLLYQQALNLREKVFGSEHPEVAQTLNNMAILYRRMAKYEEAVSLCQRSLEIKENFLGPSHPSVSHALNNLAEVYKEMGKCEMAVPLCHRALEIREKTLEISHPSIAVTLNLLAGIYGSMGDYKKALLLYHQALDIRKKMLGVEHPDTAETLNDLAKLYRNTGESEKALSLCHQALDIREKVFGTEHPDVAETLNNLAEIYESIGKTEKAQLLYQQALDIRKRALGPEHPDTAKTLSSLAGICKKNKAPNFEN